MSAVDTGVQGEPPGPTGLHRLSAREREVLALIAAGHSNVGIAEQLVVNIRTVETHTSRIFTKLGLDDDHAVHRRVLAALVHLQALDQREPALAG